MRTRWVVGAACVWGALAAVAGAGESWERWKLDFRRMNCYPIPFQDRDREAVRAPFVLMEARGWQRQCTLGDEHFDSETQQLTRSGELKIRWILTQAPESRRAVFVVRGASEEITATRLDGVQLATARMLPQGPLPEVLATNVPPPGWPAEYVNDIDKKIQESIPSPRLPEASVGSGK